MIKVEKQPDGSGEMRLMFQEDNVLGNFYAVDVNDHQGLELLVLMAQFYRDKGINVSRMVEVAASQLPGPWTRFKQALSYFLRGK